MDRILVMANLPIATSVNDLYERTRRGAPRLSEAAQMYINDALWILNKSDNAQIAAEFAPHRLIYADWEEINRLQAAKILGKKERKTYCIKTLVVINGNTRDLDNTQKLMQDVLAEFIGINDLWIFEQHNRKLIDKKATPHVKVVLSEVTVDWTSEQLIEEANYTLLAQQYQGEQKAHDGIAMVE